MAAASQPWCRSLAAAALLSLLAGCAANGDFGRDRPSPMRDKMQALAANAADLGFFKPSRAFQFTDEERRLRDLAYPLIDPPYDRNRWDQLLAQYSLNGQPRSQPDRAAYSARLFETAYRSQTARYNRLIEDIRNDTTKVEPFLAVARYVLVMDRKRQKALAHLSHLTQEERNKAMQRIEENRTIVQWVRTSLHERAASYRLALERLVVEAPSPVAVEAERALALLQQRITFHLA